MSILIGWAAKLVGEKFAAAFTYGLLVVAALGALWWIRHDAYQDGVRATDTKWVEAGDKLEKQAAKAAGTATAASVKRVEANNAQVAKEKEKLDAAEDAGSSPLDVLFGG